MRKSMPVAYSRTASPDAAMNAQITFVLPALS
jgi:hypothetical protein